MYAVTEGMWSINRLETAYKSPVKADRQIPPSIEPIQFQA